jgi:hypothetical protein
MKNPRLLQTTKTMLATVALTGLIAGAAARSYGATTPTSDQTSVKGQQASVMDDTSKHDCKGKNSCKGQGGCKTSDNGCKGKNSCKGKGGCQAA